MFGWMAFGVGEGLVCKILARISSRFSSMKTNKGVLVYRYLLQRGGGSNSVSEFLPGVR